MLLATALDLIFSPVLVTNVTETSGYTDAFIALTNDEASVGVKLSFYDISLAVVITAVINSSFFY